MPDHQHQVVGHPADTDVYLYEFNRSEAEESPVMSPPALLIFNGHRRGDVCAKVTSIEALKLCSFSPIFLRKKSKFIN